MNKDTRATESGLHISIRYLIYTAAIFTLAAALPWMVRDGSGKLFCENGPVEWLQFSCLIGICAASFSGIYLAPALKRVLVLLGSAAFLALARELDMILDARVPFAGWKIGWLPLVCAVLAAWRHRREFLPQARWFISSRAFSLMWAGFIVTVAFGQLLGYERFLKSLMGEMYARDYRRVIQETLELMGYILILIGAIEAIVRVRVITRPAAAGAFSWSDGISVEGNRRRLYNEEYIFKSS